MLLTEKPNKSISTMSLQKKKDSILTITERIMQMFKYL